MEVTRRKVFGLTVSKWASPAAPGLNVGARRWAELRFATWGLVGLAAASIAPGLGRAQPAAAAAVPSTAGAPVPVPAEGEVGADASAPPVAPEVAGAAAPVAPLDEGQSNVRLRDLERRVGELKEQVFRSKARLSLLKESVLGGVIGGSRALIVHQNEMGSLFKLVRMTYALDGTSILGRADDSGKLDGERVIQVFSGAISPGNHTVSLMLEYEGYGYGVFSYLKAYHFTVRSSHTFTVEEGRLTELLVRAYEKGNSLTTELKDKPSVEYKATVRSSSPEPSIQAAQ
jgi:hypothetical protein